MGEFRRWWWRWRRRLGLKSRGPVLLRFANKPAAAAASANTGSPHTPCVLRNTTAAPMPAPVIPAAKGFNFAPAPSGIDAHDTSSWRRNVDVGMAGVRTRVASSAQQQAQPHHDRNHAAAGDQHGGDQRVDGAHGGSNQPVRYRCARDDLRSRKHSPGHTIITYTDGRAGGRRELLATFRSQ